MTSLRQAAQQALEAMETAEVDPHSSDAVYKAITALKSALAEPVQEPPRAYYTIDEINAKFDPPQRKPLAEWQINDLMADIDPEDVDSWSFRQGVYAAEKHHGIKP